MSDNNWPEQTRVIIFDTNADTWTYDAAANRDQPESGYTGDAETKTISLYPTSPGLGSQPCSFCAKEPTKPSAKAGDNMQVITLLGSDTNHADVIVTDDAGHRLGYVDGTLVNEIPGARVDNVISNQDWINNITPGVSDNDADYSFDLAGIIDQPDSTINLGLSPQGGSLALQYVGSAPTSSVSL